MFETRKLVALIGMTLAVGSMSTSAFAVTKRTAAAADADVRALVRMMDKDQNGAVSRDEFLQYMGQVFDRLDVNRSGQLEPAEVRPLASSNWVRCDALALQRGIGVNERRSSETGPSPWKQFMDSCLAGRVR
jgi:Ca2+-binding EF-hand superfamily protein